MTDEINYPAGWKGLWLQRLDPDLYASSTGIYAGLTLGAIAIAIRCLIHVRSTRKELLANPSTRATILSASNKKLSKFMRGQLYIAMAYFFSSLVILSVDLYIGCTSLDNTAGQISVSYLDYAIDVIGVFAISTALFLLFPVLQVILAFRLVQSRHKSVPQSFPATNCRVLTTEIGQLWAVLAFVLTAYWPALDNPIARNCLLQAALGSCIVWLRLSFVMNFNPEVVDCLEEPQLLHSRETYTGYGTQIFGNTRREGLPVQEPAVQVERMDEKAGL